MTARSMVLVAAAALMASGCGEDRCPTEAPKTEDFQQTCAAASPGEVVSIPVTLCPTCNQQLAGCTADQISPSQILLDPVVEACTSDTCDQGPTCDLFPAACTFTAPNTADVFFIEVLADPDAAQPTWHQMVLDTTGAGCT